MIAGPIIRPADFLPQLQRPLALNASNFYIGGQMFLLGMTKKIVVADNLAGFVDVVFAHPDRFDGWTILQAVIAYSIQIFCDFSGYSDMALGTAKMLGFELPVNFRMPYVSLNITEFWRRWHISLSSWLRDYLYIPLGGNRKGIKRTYLNLMITMALGGLWHGASWNFVIWGVLHGIGLSVHKLYSHWRQTYLPASARALTEAMPVRAISWLLTYAFVCFGWIFFRAQHFETASMCLQKLGGVAHAGMTWLCGPFLAALPFVIAAHLLGLWMEKNDLKVTFLPQRFHHWLLLFSWILGLFFLCATQAAPFIYFQF
jgi:alginate O-acetyltransferase complex protein AlgI